MKKLWLNTLVAGVVMAASTATLAAGDAAAGKDKSGQCAACHGQDGNSAAPNFPKLAGQNEKYIIKQLQDMQKDDAGNRARNVAEMAGIVDGLSEQDVADLAAYYAGQTVKPGAAKAELLEKGASVYRAGVQSAGVAACTGCHGPDGKGNKGAGYPVLAGQHADYIEKQLRAFRTGSEEPQAQTARTNDGDAKIMRDVASRMSDLEIRAVASFISGLK